MKPAFLDSSNLETFRFVKGNLSVMPLPDLIQWVEISHNSGTLVINNDIVTRWFFFQRGKLIFAWSDSEGERFCVEIHKETGLAMEQLKETMEQAEYLGISFLGLLSSNKGVQLGQLSRIMQNLAERALNRSFNWKTGQFCFSDRLPPAVVSSPVTVSASQLLFDSAVLLNETCQADQEDLDTVINDIFEKVRKGTIEVPPIPTEMQQLMNRISAPDLSINEIIEYVNDPLLVSKVLKVCNSSFYGLRGKIDTLRQAVVYIGMKALSSIVTVHALSGYSPRNVEQVQQILHHSMAVGMIAKQLAQDVRLNHEQAFVCGLLHDLGKIIMLEVLTGYSLSPEKRDLLVERHHAVVGGLVIKRWNFSDEVREAVRFHHEPDNAQEYPQLVELIHLANLLARNEAPAVDVQQFLNSSRLHDVPGLPFKDHLDALDKEIEAILTSV